MKNSHRYLPCALLLSVSPLGFAESDLTQALKEGDLKLNFRSRFEDVDQDGVKGSDVLNLRTRLTYQSGSYQGFKILLEMDDVTNLTDDDFNDGTGTNPGTAVIADPEGTEINQAYLNYQYQETQLRYGRQRILLDNQRFVGGVGWRQNEQTYDAVSVTDETLDGLKVFYAYVYNVNRIFGESVDAGDHDHETHLLNLSYSGLDFGKLVAYAYLIDTESAPALANDTYGLRWEGKINEMFSYNLEYATQEEAGDNPVSYSADYFLAEVVAKVQRFNVKIGYELLGSDDGERAFTTSLATLHAFQGWTDKFLATPNTGVEDLYASVGTKVGRVNLSVVYHDLSADEGNADHGTELGFVAGTKIGPVGLTLKYADYDTDGFATDTQKLWLMATASF